METNKLNWEFINQGSFNSFELSTLPLTLQYGGRKSFKTGAELRQAQVSYPDTQITLIALVISELVSLISFE